MSDELYYTKHSFGKQEAQAAYDQVAGGWVSQGPVLREFEETLANSCGAASAAAVSSGTMALFVAYAAVGIGPGDEVLLPTLTFLATGNAAWLHGADVVLADVGPDLNLTFEQVERRITERTKLVVPVHFAGRPCRDLPRIRALCEERGIAVVEDAAHAHGAFQKGPDGERVPVGSCVHSDAATFSFHPAKTICTGEGGAITAPSTEMGARLALLRNHGMIRGGPDADGPWHLDQEELGINGRLTDILAAIGLVQLGRLPDFVSRRRALAERYLSAFSGVGGLLLPGEDDPGESCWNLFVIRAAEGGGARRDLIERLEARGVHPSVHYTPLHHARYYRERGSFPREEFPVAEEIYRTSLSLPLYPDLTEAQQDRVIEAILG